MLVLMTLADKAFYLFTKPQNLGLTKLKAFADDKFNAALIIIPFFDRAENIVGKEENANHQHFLSFPHCFQKALSQYLQKLSISTCQKSGLCGKELKNDGKCGKCY